MKPILIRQSIFINKPPGAVWDFTQNYELRSRWDPSVQKAEVLETLPHRVVKLYMKGKTTMTFIYKLDDRPNKTTLVAKDISSPLIEAAGGFWSYEETNGGTLWTQTNSIALKNRFWVRIVFRLLKWMFERQAWSAMQRTRMLLESK